MRQAHRRDSSRRREPRSIHATPVSRARRWLPPSSSRPSKVQRRRRVRASLFAGPSSVGRFANIQKPPRGATRRPHPSARQQSLHPMKRRRAGHSRVQLPVYACCAKATPKGSSRPLSDGTFAPPDAQRWATCVRVGSPAAPSAKGCTNRRRRANRGHACRDRPAAWRPRAAYTAPRRPSRSAPTRLAPKLSQSPRSTSTKPRDASAFTSVR